MNYRFEVDPNIPVTTLYDLGLQPDNDRVLMFDCSKSLLGTRTIERAFPFNKLNLSSDEIDDVLDYCAGKMADQLKYVFKIYMEHVCRNVVQTAFKANCKTIILSPKEVEPPDSNHIWSKELQEGDIVVFDSASDFYDQAYPFLVVDGYILKDLSEQEKEIVGYKFLAHDREMKACYPVKFKNHELRKQRHLAFRVVEKW